MDNEVYLTVLKYEVSILKGRLKPEDTGHIHTTIGVLQERIKEIETNLKAAKAYKDYQVHSLS